MPHRPIPALLLLLVAVAAQDAAAQSRLVIAGGGVSRDNAALYQAVLEGRQGDDPICVIPTASPDLEGARGSMNSAVQTLQRHGGADAAVGVLLSVENADDARRDDVASQLRRCSGFYFTGGVQSRTIRVLRPDAGDTPALQAILDRYRAGAMVGGSSAGAAVMSDPMIAGGSTTRALTGGALRASTDDDDGGVSITRGIGFLPGAIVDQHFLARGRIGRLIAAVRDLPEFDLGFGVDEDTGLVVENGVAWAVGSSGVIIVDARTAVIERRSVRNLSLHLMSTGDRYDLDTRALSVSAGKTALPRSAQPLDAPDEIFARWQFLHLLDGFARSTQERLTIAFDGGELTLRKAGNFLAAAATGEGVQGTPAGLSVRGLLLDVLIP
jgi:cyanophycinase